MESVATREILWNVSSSTNTYAMYITMTLALVIGGVGILRHAELWSSGQPAPEHRGRWFQRFFDLYAWGLLQRGVVRERIPALAHSLIYIGFLALLFTTTMVFIDHDLGIRIYQGEFYLAVTLLSDVLGIGVLIGCLIAAHRRYLSKPDLVHNRMADSLVLWLLSLLILQGFVLEGLRIHATNDPWALYSPIGLFFSRFFWPLSYEATTLLHVLAWWFHTITVFATIALAPYTKFFHIIASSANLYFRNSGRAKGALKDLGDLEKLMETSHDLPTLGLSTIKDYSWKELMDLDACTSCGRCQAACPAYKSGKPLSPKWLILDTRNHALALNAKGQLEPSFLTRILPKFLTAIDRFLTLSYFLPQNGLVQSSENTGYTSRGEFRGENVQVQSSAKLLGESAHAKIAGEVMDKDVFWSCTTCMACVEACPVGINHVDQIMGNRRALVLMEGEVPSEAQATLRSLENRGNPFGDPLERVKWLEGLDVKILKPGDSVDYLYWVGCVSAYDPRKQKIARALVTLMREAGLSFGILGTSEGCSGDPARRLGEENLFQTLAKKNIETLKAVRFSTLVANCPHCFNTIKNEYPQLGNLGNGKSPNIIHHSVLLKALVDQGKLCLKDSADSQYTFHDPCYLGRYNDEYDAPRDSLKAVPGLEIVEMEESRNKGLCCGAGGGHFWMDMKIGERINVIRINQAAKTGSKRVSTACPFCMQMLEDGAKLTNREESLAVKDIAEVLLEHLVSRS